MRQLLRLRTETAIRDRLGRLPNDLKDAYDEIYQEIDNLHYEDKEIAHRAFEWVICAKTPLKLKELLHAVCQDPASMEYQEPREEVDESLILDLCHNLLVFDTELHHWRVSHLSVVEYFEENQLHGVRDAHCHVAKVCFSVLTNTSLWPKSAWETSHAFISMSLHKPLIQYALASWLTHVVALEALPAGEVDRGIAELLQDFLGEPTKGSPSYTQWHEFMGSRSLSYALKVLSPTEKLGVTGMSTPMQFACHLGLFNLLLEWWSSPDLDINMQTPLGLEDKHHVLDKGSWTLLSHAIYMGHESIYNCLLRCGADPSLAGKGSWTPLEVAAYRDSTAAALSLLRRGAGVGGPEGHENAAIFSAVRKSSTAVLNLLLSKGGNANAARTGEGNLLVTAVRSGDKGSVMVKCLIEAGADVTATSPCEYGSPVAAAAHLDDLKSLRRLLKAGADPQLRIPGKWGSALATAAANPWGRPLSAMKLLIEYGADPNALLSVEPPGTIASALAVAVRKQAVYNIELLLRNGADVNMLLPSECHCALQVAVMGLRDGYYSTEVLETLLRSGADVNLEAPPGVSTGRVHSVLNTVFQLASAGRLRGFPVPWRRPPWNEAAKLLVEYGAAWYGDLGKLKSDLLRQWKLKPEIVKGLFRAEFVEKLQHNNNALAALRSGS